ITSVAILAAAFSVWRLGADLGWINDSLMPHGVLSHWQLWFAIAIGAHCFLQWGKENQRNSSGRLVWHSRGMPVRQESDQPVFQAPRLSDGLRKHHNRSGVANRVSTGSRRKSRTKDALRRQQGRPHRGRCRKRDSEG